MEFGKGKAGTGELPPPNPSSQLPMAVESLEAAAGVTPPTTNVLMRQTSIGSANAASKINTNTNTNTNINCLCSPTTHAGSFRCRLHRAPSSSLQRTKSIDTSDSVAAATAPTDS